jgi:hypothetical protein
VSDPPATNGTAYRLTVLESNHRAIAGDIGNLKVAAAVMDKQLSSIAQDVEAIRNAEEKREERETANFRWRAGFAIAVVSAILAAATIVASALPT